MQVISPPWTPSCQSESLQAVLCFQLDQETGAVAATACSFGVDHRATGS